MWNNITAQYIKENCDTKGKQRSDQLDKSQLRGKLKLQARVRKKEIYISPSNKGNGIVAMAIEMYEKLVKTHTDKDREVTWKELEEAQKAIRSHARSLGKICGLGLNEGERNIDRCNQNLSSWACDPPILRAVAKTHKATDPEGTPKSRPIVEAARGLTTPLGEQLSDLLEPVAKCRSKIWEAQSTEEVLRKIGEANLTVETQAVKQIIVGSLNVEALYPSIDQKEGPRLVSEEVFKSNL